MCMNATEIVVYVIIARLIVLIMLWCFNNCRRKLIVRVESADGNVY